MKIGDKVAIFSCDGFCGFVSIIEVGISSGIDNNTCYRTEDFSLFYMKGEIGTGKHYKVADKTIWMVNKKYSSNLRGNARRFYATALFAEKLYSSNIFGDKTKEDIAYCNLCQDMRNNPQTSWEITTKQYPYLIKAEQEALKQLDITGYELTYWQLLDAIVWSLEEDPCYWREIITAYAAEFLAIPVTPRNKFKQAIVAIKQASNLQCKANIFCWSTRHLAYKLLKKNGYCYLGAWKWKKRNVGYWLDFTPK